MDVEDPRNIEIEDIHFSSEDEEKEKIEVYVAKKYIRDGQNPLEFYNEKEFKKRFRFSKQSVFFGILPLIEQGLRKLNNHGLPISPILQLLICLRFYSTASFQFIVGDVLQISQSIISRIVYQVSILIASIKSIV